MTMRIAPAAFLLLPALLLAALPVAGQSYVAWQEEWDGIVRKAPLTLGPLRLFPTFSLSNVGYDDNIYFDNAPKSDYTGTFSPELKAYLPIGGTILLSASENPEYTYYVRDASRRTFTNSVAVGLKIRLLSSFILSGQYKDYAHRRKLSPEVGALVTDRGKAWDAGLTFETANQTAIGLTAFRGDLSYESFEIGPEELPLSQALNRTESGGRAEIYYRAFYKGYLFLGIGLTEYRFQSPDMAWRNATARQASLGARFPVGGSIEGSINVGYKQFKPSQEDRTVFSGFFGSADLSTRLGRFGFRGRFGRDNSFSVYADVLYFLQTFGGAGASLYVTDFLRLDYDFELGTSDYPDAPDEMDSGRTAGRIDRRTTHTAGFAVRIFRTAGIGLTWNSSLWTSTRPGWDRRRSFVGAYLTYRF
jgi:hypothetical protein